MKSDILNIVMNLTIPEVAVTNIMYSSLSDAQSDFIFSPIYLKVFKSSYSVMSI